jgi:hypothetical protein
VECRAGFWEVGACEIGSSVESGCFPELKINDLLSMKCRKVVDEHFKRVIMLLISPHLSTSSFEHYFQKQLSPEKIISAEKIL